MRNLDEFPETLYVTPDEWGDHTFVVTKEELEKMVADLRTIDDRWKSVGAEDATEINFVRQIGDNKALYEGWRREKGFQYAGPSAWVIVKTGPDDFDLDEFYETAEKADR